MRFYALQVHPGQSTLVFYTAHNLSDKAITGVSTYNVAPQQAGYYFNKIQCFCFEEQKLRPGDFPFRTAAPCESCSLVSQAMENALTLPVCVRGRACLAGL